MTISPKSLSRDSLPSLPFIAPELCALGLQFAEMVVSYDFFYKCLFPMIYPSSFSSSRIFSLELHYRSTNVS
ncbi:putative E3 ubiquitin-protein ligase [Sesbania bispinosa]|nr:putative E3 ubiquitin-protein ligase [Sesbania bispinosa]